MFSASAIFFTETFNPADSKPSVTAKATFLVFPVFDQYKTKAFFKQLPHLGHEINKEPESALVLLFVF